MLSKSGILPKPLFVQNVLFNLPKIIIYSLKMEDFLTSSLLVRFYLIRNRTAFAKKTTNIKRVEISYY